MTIECVFDCCNYFPIFKSILEIYSWFKMKSEYNMFTPFH